MAVWSMAEKARVYGGEGRREVVIPDRSLKALAKDCLASLCNMAWFWILRRPATAPARGCISDQIDTDCPGAAEAERSELRAPTLATERNASHYCTKMQQDAYDAHVCNGIELAA